METMLRTTLSSCFVMALAIACNESDLPLGNARGNIDDDSGVGTGATAGFGGTGGAGASGTGGAAGSGGFAGCFSPTQHPNEALSGGQGCECAEEEGPVCVQLIHVDLGEWRLSLHCVDGRWASVEDGICDLLPGTSPACKVFDRIYPNGARGIPDQTSCNTCSCVDGELVCTQNDCPLPCPVPGMSVGKSCYLCGADDTCEIVLHGCHTPCAGDENCNGYDTCHDGICQSLCGAQ
jgi:hypothetical protein